MTAPPGLFIPRRRFLQSLAGSAAALSLPQGAWGAEGDGKTVTVSILNTTDLHGHIMPTKTYAGEENVGGMARCVTQIRAWQKENPNHILMDIGDVYQGTHVSRATGGALMIDLFNRMNYDAWVIGNHEFDWGLDTLTKCVTASKGKVLAANAQVGGKWTNEMEDRSHPLAKIAPYFIKEVAGFRIGVVGVVTPGLPAWLNPGLLKEFSAADPLESVKLAIRRLKQENADAIVLASHFGLKGVRDGKGTPDDFANRIHEITKECRELNVVIAGHTHRDIAELRVNEILYTQASYYGIHAGRTDLLFDRESRKLLDVKVRTARMDRSVELDAMIVSASARDVEASNAELRKEIGELAEPLSCKGSPGEPAPSLRLIMSAIRHSLEKRGQKVAGVLHGLFLDDKDLAAGKKTIADAWEIIPYENRLATVELTGADLASVGEETMSERSSTHGLSGFKVTVTGKGQNLKITGLTFPDGKPVEAGQRYRIALNGYDAQSGSRRYGLLANLCAAPEAKMTLHDIESRDAVIEFFTDRRTVRAADLAG